MARTTKSAAPAAIVGAPTEATKTAERAKRAAKPKGGKPGQALTSQTAEYAAGEVAGTDGNEVARLVAAKAAQKDAGGMAGKSAAKITRAKAREAQAAKPNADKITESKNTVEGNHVAVKAGDKTVVIRKLQMTAELNKLAQVGGSMKAVEAYIAAHKPEAKLANGLTGKDAPQSAMAAAASRKAPAAPAAPAKTGKTAKVAAAKEAKAATPKAGKVGDDAKLVEVAANPKKPGTSTHARYAAAYKVGRTIAEVLKHTTRADIDWDLKRGFIKLG